MTLTNQGTGHEPLPPPRGVRVSRGDYTRSFHDISMLQVEHSYSPCGHIVESSAGGIQAESKSPPTSKVDPHPRFAHCILLDSNSFEANMEQTTSANPTRLQNMRRKALPSLISRVIHEIFQESDTVWASEQWFPGQSCVNKSALQVKLIDSDMTDVQLVDVDARCTWRRQYSLVSRIETPASRAWL